jgi:hypothetical protein
MSRASNWKLKSAIGLAAAAFLGGAAGLAALAGQTGPFMWTGLFGFAQSHDKLAFQALEHGTGPAALAQASKDIKGALSEAPYDNAARLRAVYVDTLAHGTLGPDGLARLAESYELIPYDYTVAAWRIQFGLEHWNALTPELRLAVFSEAMAFGRQGSRDVDVRRTLQSIHNPDGRLAAALWLRALNH